MGSNVTFSSFLCRDVGTGFLVDQDIVLDRSGQKVAAEIETAYRSQASILRISAAPFGSERSLCAMRVGRRGAASRKHLICWSCLLNLHLKGNIVESCLA